MFKILIAALALTFLLNSNVMAVYSNSGEAPKTRNAALNRSLAYTLVPAALGGALMLHGQRISPLAFHKGGSKTNDDETLLGLAIGSMGIVFGPGTGHLYAHRWSKYQMGTGIRVAGGALIIAGIASFDPWSGSGGFGFAPLLILGSTVVVSSAIFDIATVGDSVEEYNEESGFGRLSLRPVLIAPYDAPGLVLTLTF
jgi:hypothetical protein